ncbi:MAG: bifunctional DNA-formamidopyrimidine glycosylase/DNA-(apurinic or apyrimidinic site) lyase [Alphaproteobacteria bacterium]
MPELPEVETVCRGLEASLKNAIITKAEVHRSDLRIPFPKNLAERLRARRIRGITRRAKYILIELDKNETLLLHLGMSGRMTISKTKSKPGKHDHLVFHFNNGLHVSFNDPRRFGMCDLVPTDKLDQHKLVKHLGVEPLCDDLTTDYLAAKFKGKKTSIKIAIMDQRLVVGVGNIYASEALFHAGINPKRLAGKVKRDEIAKLVPAIRKVLKAAIKAGGSSLRDYVQSDGELGYFQHQFSVYGKTSEKCRDCNCNTAKTGGIKQITQGGRSSFYCPIKQL